MKDWLQQALTAMTLGNVLFWGFWATLLFVVCPWLLRQVPVPPQRAYRCPR
jgi:hypothetical protein